MKEYRHGAHAVCEIHLPLVWTTKHRKRIMAGEVGRRVRELTRVVCRQREVTILRGSVRIDQVHLLVSVLPQVTISRLVPWLKGRSSHHLPAEFADLRKAFWAGTCGHEATFVAAAAT